MSEFLIKKATRKAKKLRLGLEAPSGFGKTYSALLLAYGITGNWEDVCIIDTEKDSASLYANLGSFSTISLQAPYSPERYIEAIKTVEEAGFKVCIIDSITPEWEGSGGCLEIHQQLGGTFKEWNPVGKRHTAFINKILNSKIHIITTVRKKQEHEIVEENGKKKVQKVGLKAQTRDGFEYELDINFEITNHNHIVVASKDRTRLFTNKPEFVISEDTGKIIKEWCEEGTSSLDEALEKVRNTGDIKDLTVIYNAYKAELESNPDFLEAVKRKKEELTK